VTSNGRRQQRNNDAELADYRRHHIVNDGGGECRTLLWSDLKTSPSSRGPVLESYDELHQFATPSGGEDEQDFLKGQETDSTAVDDCCDSSDGFNYAWRQDIMNMQRNTELSEEDVTGKMAEVVVIEAAACSDTTAGVMTRTKRFVSCCKRFMEFLFSTVGLSCLLVGYIVLGGLIFKSLEAPNEVRMKNDMKRTIRWVIVVPC